MSSRGTSKRPISILDSDLSDDEIRSSTSSPEPSPLPYDETIKDPRLLTGLPLELLTMIVMCPILGPLDRYNLDLTSQRLRLANFTQADNITKREYKLFHRRFEASLPSRLHLCAQHLLCTHCLSFLPTASFPDAHAKRACSPPRSCVDCSIRRGHFNRLCFKLQGVMSFACGACKRALPLSELADIKQDLDRERNQDQDDNNDNDNDNDDLNYIDDGHHHHHQRQKSQQHEQEELRLIRKFGGFRYTELKLKMRDRRWCRGCWIAISGFWKYVEQTGRMREKFGPEGM